jgi:hypothetical protein
MLDPKLDPKVVLLQAVSAAGFLRAKSTARQRSTLTR